MSTITFLFSVIVGLYSLLAYLNPAALERLNLPVNRSQRFWYLILFTICAIVLSGSWLIGIGGGILIWLFGDGANYIRRWFN